VRTSNYRTEWNWCAADKRLVSRRPSAGPKKTRSAYIILAAEWRIGRAAPSIGPHTTIEHINQSSRPTDRQSKQIHSRAPFAEPESTQSTAATQKPGRPRCSAASNVNKLPFLPRGARCYASAVLAMALCLSVRPSVRPSVTSRSSTKTAKRRITQTTPHDSPGTLVFLSQRSPRNSTGVTPYGGAKCRWGGSKSSTFDK